MTVGHKSVVVKKLKKFWPIRQSQFQKNQKALENNFFSCYTHHYVISRWKLTNVPSNLPFNINLVVVKKMKKMDQSDSRRTATFEKQTKTTRKVVIPTIWSFYDFNTLKLMVQQKIIKKNLNQSDSRRMKKFKKPRNLFLTYVSKWLWHL